jgi:hypothetical protein
VPVALPDICRVEQESEYGGGLYFFSGEVGNRRAGVMPFVFRVRNRGVSVFDSSWHVTHNAVSNIDSLRSKLKDFVHEQIPLVDIAIEKLLALKTTIFTTDSEYALERLCIATASFFRGMLANKDIRLMAVATAAERSALNTSELSAFVVQNAFTRVARATDDHLRRIQLNMIAGKMVNLDWEKVAKVASGISDAQVCKVFKIKEEE